MPAFESPECIKIFRYLFIKRQMKEIASTSLPLILKNMV